MKQMRLFLLLGFLLLGLAASQAHAQDPTVVGTPPAADSTGSALLNEYAKDYDVVFKAVKTALESMGYEVNYSSKKKHLIETSFKQLANEDDFFDVMKKYGDIPYIRSPGWTIGRAKISVNFEEIDAARTGIKVIAQLSGYESRFETKWLYWNSNGKLEDDAMMAINTTVEASQQ